MTKRKHRVTIKGKEVTVISETTKEHVKVYTEDENNLFVFNKAIYMEDSMEIAQLYISKFKEWLEE